ncbi:MAG: KamA family radical SAM protein [Leptospiraceae bacterium]|nr:KamA family radical SAM protein [Leptospiraceae bacterium]MCK6380564.1 KamA family radical SAM protein [Leptospiraceae bacterium]NUM40735.1 KamA family radical SAM protein [Leptospiraceae bacterium]
MSIQEEIKENRKALFQKVEWNNYTSQLRNRVHSADLKKYFLLTESEKEGILKSIRLNVGVTPYYLSLSDPFDYNCPIRKMIVPRIEESIFSHEESLDPLHEERLSPVTGLTRMYKDRVLLFANHECSVYCRHCMRGRKVSDNKNRMDKEKLESCFQYIEKNEDITDVVISGGDPFNLSDSKIDWILKKLHSIQNVKIARIGTRNPVTLPMRLTHNLLKIIEKYNNDFLSIFCNTQFNHEKECTEEAKGAILKLLKAGVSVGNQCVILKGINDSGEVMLSLHKKLLELRVRAYYMYDPELIPGSRGFRTPLQKGIEIIEYMRGKIAGMGIPSFVTDLPGGGGKVTLSPNWYIGFHKKSRNHVFQSAAKKTYHFSFEPIDSSYDSLYKEIDDELYQKIQNEMESK